jgi:hypothetical protein
LRIIDLGGARQVQFHIAKQLVVAIDGARSIYALAAVNGPHVQGVSPDKSDLLGGTKVGQPVPAKQTLASDD